MFLLRPPNLVRRGPFFERKNVCNSQENGVRTRCAAIVNHPSVLKILRVVNLLRVVFLVRRGPLGKAGHNKAGRSDFRNQRFEADTAKMRKMRTVSLTPEKQGSEGIPQSENAENAENADTKTRKMRKMRLTGFNVNGFG